MKVHLTLPVPPSGNHYKATRVVKVKGRQTVMWYLTKEAQAYKEQAAWYARSLGVNQPLTGRVHIHVELYPARPLDWAKRQRKDPTNWDDTVARQDLDNCRKVLYDALKDVVFADDKMVFADSGEVMEPDEHGARVEVTITSIVRATSQKQLLPDAPPVQLVTPIGDGEPPF